MNMICLVGRVAQLCGLISKPELNGLYVVLEGYNQQADRHKVRTLVVPSKASKVFSFSVKFESLKFAASDEFAQHYPDAPVHSSDSMLDSDSGLPSGHILHISDDNQSDFIHTLLVQIPALVRGEQPDFKTVDVLCPTSTFRGVLYIEPADENSSLEFVDLHFSRFVQCRSGRSIIFRRCKFTGPEAGAKIGLGEKSVNVTFESCLFECEDTGIFLAHDSHVTLLNCIVRNGRGYGVRAPARGSVTIIHSTIAAMEEDGVYVTSKIGTIEILNSAVVDCVMVGISARSNHDIVIRGCSVTRCRQQPAIIISSSKHISVHITDTQITDSNIALFLRLGHLQIHMERVEIARIRHIGMLVSPLTKGSAAFTTCLVHCNPTDVANLAATDAFLVIVDGVPIPSHLFSDFDQRRAQACMDEIAGHQSLPADERRVMKNIGGVDIKCDHCGAVEGTEEKFKACGKCKRACYCSRACQVAHWKEHKESCKK